MLQKILRIIGAGNSFRRITNHQFIGRRQTEYHNPKFLSFHCGSAQFFATMSGDSVAFAGATGVPLEHAPNSAANKTTNPNRIGRAFLSAAAGSGWAGRHTSCDRLLPPSARILRARLWRLRGDREQRGSTRMAARTGVWAELHFRAKTRHLLILSEWR
jgi:hypothetical protein